jgi:Green fluorescent protein
MRSEQPRRMANDMDNEATEDVHVLLSVRGNVNGVDLLVEGSSKGRTGGGLISAEAASLSVLPDGFQLGFLPYVLITGQPSLSLAVDGTHNPFITTGGAYEAVRTLDLGDAGSLRTDYSVVRKEPSQLMASFFISGSVTAPRLRRILPTLEVWSPKGDGLILGHFSMVWETMDGSYLKGEAETSYQLATPETIGKPRYRFIEIDMSYSDEHLSQSERITLMSETALARHLSMVTHASEGERLQLMISTGITH